MMSTTTATPARPSPPAPSLFRTIPVAVAVAGLSACSATSDKDSQTDAETDAAGRPSSGRAVHAEYDQGWGELGRVHLEVTTTGPQQVRVHMSTPDDDPVSEWMSVYDGQQLLQSGNDPEGYFLYPDPEDSEFFQLTRSLVLPPGSDLLADACPGAQRLGTQMISGLTAVGYRCGPGEGDSFGNGREIWVEEGTGLTLVAPRLELVQASPDAPVDETTFSTEAPAGVDARVVDRPDAGARSSSRDEGSHSSPEDKLRAIAASTDEPVYYLGPAFDDDVLTDVFLYSDRSGRDVPNDLSLDDGQSLAIGYGDGLALQISKFQPGRYRHAVGCSRLEPQRGVPTVAQADAVWLFTDEQVVRLGDLAYSPELVAPAAAALVEVGRPPTDDDLPPPPRASLPIIDRACGANPGDHGRPIEN